ncbi:MAG TPA: winged helix-turn-helix domain-containing protein [Kineosporiaceae bacterium]|nr:winged helix-turn-helix domain-containing protein [Kineosporiaceae bacterium]
MNPATARPMSATARPVSATPVSATPVSATILGAQAGVGATPAQAERLVMLPPGAVPEGARVVAVVALLGPQERDPGTCRTAPGRWTGRPGADRPTAVAMPVPIPLPAPQQIADGLLIDLGARQVFSHGNPLDLTRREFDLLAHLSSRPGRVLTRAQLLAAAWGVEDVRYVGLRTVDVHVARLRRKLGAGRPTVLDTVRGVGYRWVSEPKVTHR